VINRGASIVLWNIGVFQSIRSQDYIIIYHPCECVAKSYCSCTSNIDFRVLFFLNEFRPSRHYLLFETIYNIWYIIYLLYTRSSYIIYIVICLKRIFRVVVRLRTFIVYLYVILSLLFRVLQHIGTSRIVYRYRANLYMVWNCTFPRRLRQRVYNNIYNIFILYF